MKILSLFLITFCCMQVAFAQTTGNLKGVITDLDSKEPVMFANVVLEQKNGEVKGTQTDFDGNYVFNNIPTGVYDLKVHYVGYSSKAINGIKIKEGETTIQHVVMEAGTMVECMVMSEVKAKKGRANRSGKNRISKSREKKSRGPIYSPVGKPSSPSYSDQITRKESNNNSKQAAPPVERPGNNTEEYSTFAENEYLSVQDAPLSTFSIDVDRASYSNMRRYLNQGQKPPKDAIRIEELVNYFDYNYPQPTTEHPFSVITEVSDCPWNKEAKLVHIGMQGKNLDLSKASANNLVFLIDVSGSMSAANKLPLLKESLKLLINNMRPQDKISLVVYAGAAGVVQRATSDKNKLYKALDRLNAGGSTAGGKGIQLAYKIAKEQFVADGNNRVLIATDGDFNVGLSSNGDLENLIVEKRQDDIFLTVLGFGMGNYKDSKMEILADKGNGNYAYIDNIKEAKKTLVNEMSGTLYTIAKDVKLQIEFNPVLVESYRLVGYENRKLNNEDFNDDKKDAGELGAGHTVTAMYEIVLSKGYKASKNAKAVDALKYQKTTKTAFANNSNELMHVKLRYKTPTGTKSTLLEQPLKNKTQPLSQASENFRWAAAVAGFGMLLRDSKFKNELTYKDVLDLAKGAKGADKNAYRQEFIDMVRNVHTMSLHAKK